MNNENAKKIIEYVAEKTKEEIFYNVKWGGIDDVFLHRGCEVQGFSTEKFDDGIFKIEKIGAILDNCHCHTDTRYNREFAGGLKKPFYQQLQKGCYGEEGKKFYKWTRDFMEDPKVKKGGMPWKVLWWLLVRCNYLKLNYDSSFASFLKKKYAQFKNKRDITDAEFLESSADDLEQFINKAEAWKELVGISENIFNYLVRDIEGNEFIKVAYKLDSANKHFLKVTGLGNLGNIIEVKNFLRRLKTKYPIGVINKGIYTYCSQTESSHFGFCRHIEKCNVCRVNNICEKNF